MFSTMFIISHSPPHHYDFPMNLIKTILLYINKKTCDSQFSLYTKIDLFHNLKVMKEEKRISPTGVVGVSANERFLC